MIGKKIEEMSRFSVEMDPPPEPKSRRRGKTGKQEKAAKPEPEKKVREKQNKPGPAAAKKESPVRETKEKNGGEKKRADKIRKTAGASVPPAAEIKAFGNAMPAFMMNEVKLS